MKRAAQTMAITNSAASFGKKQRPKSTLTWQKLQWRGAGSWEEFLFVKCLRSFLLLEKAKPQLPFSFGQGSQKESWHSFLMLAYLQNIIGNNFSQQHRGWRTCSVFLSKAWKCCAPTWSHHCSWSCAKLWQKDIFMSSLLRPCLPAARFTFPTTLTSSLAPSDKQILWYWHELWPD